MEFGITFPSYIRAYHDAKMAEDYGFTNAWFYDSQMCYSDVYAHMWFNIAASSGIEHAVKGRDIVAQEMIPSQIEKAQKLAREYVRKNYKGC